MRAWLAMGVAVVAALIPAACSNAPAPSARSAPKGLADYPGVYQWGPDAYLYLQWWNELSGSEDLVAFDESGELRTLYEAGPDRFTAGPGAARREPVESRIAIQRNADGTIASLTWQQEQMPARTARRVEIERHEEVRFPSGSVQLAGTLLMPAKRAAKMPALILVHGSGAADRDYMWPFARFLVRHGMAVLGYDKRGVGGSSGDWSSASFEDLAGDTVAAYDYLRTRADIDGSQIGMLGLSQAGSIMPLAATRAKGMAFLISVSGPGVPPSVTTIDQARNEMVASGVPPRDAEEVAAAMALGYEFARTGEGWSRYSAARARLVDRLGTAPDTLPGIRFHPYWRFVRRLYFFEPGPPLRQLRTPTLAIFGERDNNIVADKNRAAWEAALTAGGHPDFTLRTLPDANHLQLESKIGSNAEMASLRRFVPSYFSTIHDWLAQRVRGYGASSRSSQ